MIAVGDPVWLGGIIAAVIVVAIILGRNVSGKLGSLSVTVNAVNKAVNDRPAGTPTISEQMATTANRVDDIHTSVTTLTVAMDRGMADINHAVDSLDKRLSAHEVAESTQIAAINLRITALELAVHPPKEAPHI